jgi:DNA replication and repair protein RecF
VLQGETVSENEYLRRLEAEMGRDLILGHTGFGVHRDNYEFLFNGSDANGSASRGEVRSIVLAMKFIEADLIFEKTSKRPVVLLDDVFSELDKVRQKALTQNFKDNQVIITSVEVDE